MRFYHERLQPIRWNGEKVNWIQQKCDGFRITLFKQDDGRLIAYGRDDFLPLQSKLEHLPWYHHIKRTIWGRTSIDGELIIPGLPASKVSTALANHSNALALIPFAIPVWQDRWQFNVDLFTVKDYVVSKLKLEFPFFGRYTGQTEEQLLEEAQKAKFEGWVLKEGHYNGWYKVKREKTMDCIVTGFIPGKGKYSGQVGSLICSVYCQSGELIEVAKAGGMTDEERKEINDLYLGCVCEIKYQEVASRGRLRHPRFVRWRPDKPKELCTWEAQT